MSAETEYGARVRGPHAYLNAYGIAPRSRTLDGSAAGVAVSAPNDQERLELMKATVKSGIPGPLVAAVVAFLTVVALPATAQPQAGAGAGRQRPRLARIAGLMMYLERSWAIVAFEFDLTDEQLTGLRAFYKAAWDTRPKALREPGGDLAGRALALLRDSRPGAARH